MTSAFDKHFVTRDEVIQAAIDSVENPERRAAYQARFDEDRDQSFSGFAWRGAVGSKSFSKLMASNQRVEVDPERLKRWVAIAKILLPFILAFL